MKNEPAFPFFNDENLYQGITKREYFAAMAMQGMLANASYDTCSFAKIAKDSFSVTDAMLAESEKSDSDK